METTHHGEDASPDNPPGSKSGNTDEQTIALTKARQPLTRWTPGL
ncbi:MAG: hypothetical protein ACLT8C_04175 [Akkermansia muciniphila]